MFLAYVNINWLVVVVTLAHLFLFLFSVSSFSSSSVFYASKQEPNSPDRVDS